MRFASDKYIELIVENKFSEADEYRKSFIPDFLYKFVPLRSETTEEAQRENQKRLDSLEKGEIWFSSRALMNDPYEFIGMYIDESKLLKDGWPPEAVAAVQDKAKNLLFLSSLTSNVYNNMPMWAHYANNHKGYCVKYKVENKNCIYEVFYTDRRYSIGHGISKLLAYSKMIEDKSLAPEKRRDAESKINQCLEMLRMMYVIKHSSWSYENEFRIFCDAAPCGTFGKNVPAKCVGLQPAEVFCGKNCSETNVEKIIEISKRINIECSRCDISPTDFCILSTHSK